VVSCSLHEKWSRSLLEKTYGQVSCMLYRLFRTNKCSHYQLPCHEANTQKTNCRPKPTVKFPGYLNGLISWQFLNGACLWFLFIGKPRLSPLILWFNKILGSFLFNLITQFYQSNIRSLRLHKVTCLHIGLLPLLIGHLHILSVRNHQIIYGIVNNLGKLCCISEPCSFLF